MKREFYLSTQAKSKNFVIKHTEYDDYMIKKYDENGDIEDTLFFTRDELYNLFLLLSKEATQ
jgi:hypothetical protein